MTKAKNQGEVTTVRPKNGTAMACCYLAWVGTDGIALASVWVVGIMSMAAVSPIWLHDLPRPDYKYILSGCW